MDIHPVIAEMCRENTGRHFLDSGSIYGYKYDTPLPSEPVYIVGDAVLISTPHHLSGTLDRTPEAEALEAEFYAYADRPENRNKSWSELMHDFIEKEKGFTVEMEENTYNTENQLDQGFFFIMFKYQGELYVILQTHNGADIRGGYSKPRVFRVDDETLFLDWHIEYWCPNCNATSPRDFEIRDNEVYCRSCGDEACVYAPVMP